MDVQTFSVLMSYLYLGQLPPLDGTDIVGLIEAADRLCLKHMIKALEFEIVTELLRAEANGENIIEETLKLIEPAQVYFLQLLKYSILDNFGRLEMVLLGFFWRMKKKIHRKLEEPNLPIKIYFWKF